MSHNIDILSIDNQIKNNFKHELDNIPNNIILIKKLKHTLSIDNISSVVKDNILKDIKFLSSKIDKNFIEHNYYLYLEQTIQIIEKYKDLIKTPIKVSFMTNKTFSNPELKKTIDEYLIIAKKYIDINEKDNINKKILCDNCGKKNFDIIDNTYICIECGSQQEIFILSSTYKDSERINITSKYLYDRKVHFKDCINQYQGKQNCTIDQSVYDNLEIQFEKHHLLIGNKNTPKNIRFSKIDKTHIKMFLKEMNYSEHYENINLIYYNITGKKPDDISHLEDKLLSDFDKLTELYDKKYKNNTNFSRKNFINTQYVLYLLLCKHKHKCRKDDFSILKSQDRKDFHDTLTLDLFNELEWTHASV